MSASDNADTMAPKTATEVVDRPMTLVGAISMARGKRQADLLFGRRVARHMGLYRTSLPQEPEAKTSVNELPKVMDAVKKRICCRDAIERVKSHFVGRYETASLVFGWAHFDVGHDSRTLIANILDFVRKPHIRYFKVGVSQCPLWRMITCEGGGPHGSMTAHHPYWDRMCILAIEYGEMSGRFESEIVEAFKDDADPYIKNKFLNYADGGYGTIRTGLPTFVYLIANFEFATDVEPGVSEPLLM